MTYEERVRKAYSEWAKNPTIDESTFLSNIINILKELETEVRAEKFHFPSEEKFLGWLRTQSELLNWNELCNWLENEIKKGTQDIREDGGWS